MQGLQQLQLCEVTFAVSKEGVAPGPRMLKVIPVHIQAPWLVLRQSRLDFASAWHWTVICPRTGSTFHHLHANKCVGCCEKWRTDLCNASARHVEQLLRNGLPQQLTSDPLLSDLFRRFMTRAGSSPTRFCTQLRVHEGMGWCSSHSFFRLAPGIRQSSSQSRPLRFDVAAFLPAAPGIVLVCRRCCQGFCKGSARADLRRQPSSQARLCEMPTQALAKLWCWSLAPSDRLGKLGLRDLWDSSSQLGCLRPEPGGSRAPQSESALPFHRRLIDRFAFTLIDRAHTNDAESSVAPLKAGSFLALLYGYSSVIIQVILYPALHAKSCRALVEDLDLCICLC
mmetsp:Transcript_8825/g.14537  ORF Transcript_8825/g.14537 Transcript_8825/m.14537 type:complete len:339 (+) Transcript_8825:1019-2035(+)